VANIDVAEEARARGAARLVTWTTDGTLISLSAAAQAWGVGIRDIASAVQRGAVFEVWVANFPYIPAACVDLGLEQSTAICRALDGQSASAKLAFLRSSHGGLGGQSVTDALRCGVPISRICELARATILS